MILAGTGLAVMAIGGLFLHEAFAAPRVPEVPRLPAPTPPAPPVGEAVLVAAATPAAVAYVEELA